MRQAVMVFVGILLTLAATAAGSQEFQREGDRVLVKGVFQSVAVDRRQIVVDDTIFAIGPAVWIDGTSQTVDKLADLIDHNETVELELSGESRNGYLKVTRIHTNP